MLANDAGYGLLGAVEEATASEIEALYATNVFGVLKVTRAVLPHMRRQRSGHILNFSSIGGYFGYPGWGVYGSTKFAVEGLSESLAAEVAPFGIKVTIVEPGFSARTSCMTARWRSARLPSRTMSEPRTVMD